MHIHRYMYMIIHIVYMHTHTHTRAINFGGNSLPAVASGKADLLRDGLGVELNGLQSDPEGRKNGLINNIYIYIWLICGLSMIAQLNRGTCAWCGAATLSRSSTILPPRGCGGSSITLTPAHRCHSSHMQAEPPVVIT